MEPVFITTIDNPFNPFTQFEDWNRFDEDRGYNTLSYLARIANTSNEMSEEDYNNAIAMAVDEICNYNILGIYKKVREGDEITPRRA